MCGFSTQLDLIIYSQLTYMSSVSNSKRGPRRDYTHELALSDLVDCVDLWTKIAVAVAVDPKNHYISASRFAVIAG